MYLFSIFMTFLLNIGGSLLVCKRADDEGFILKTPNSGLSLGKIVVFALRFVPFVNIALATMDFAAVLVVISSDAVWNSYIEKYRYFPNKVIKFFNLGNAKKKSIEDSLEMDGAKGIKKKIELTKIELEKCNLVKEDGALFSSFNIPTFSEKEYNKAKSIIAAEQMLYEVECNVSLSSRQKAKLLKLFRKAYLSEFKHPEIEMSTEDFEVLEEEKEMVATGYNNNLVEKEIELEDTLETNELYQKILKIVN